MDHIFQDLHIFEIANNHQGRLEHGLAIVRHMGAVTREFGIRSAVKLQYRDLSTFIHPDFRSQENQKKVNHVSRFLSTRLSKDEFRILTEAIRSEGMLVVVTPFDESSVDWGVEHDVDVLKVASCSADDWPLLETIAEAGKPIIASTGGQRLADIDNLYSLFSHRNVKFAFLHCVGIYPTPGELLALDVIDRLRRRYPDVTIGYSGHENPDDTDVVKIAIAKGARILERHVGFPTDDVTLNAYSMSPTQVRAWLAAAKSARIMCDAGPVNRGGSVQLSEKTIDETERKSLRGLARGISAAVSIKKGERITRDKVFFSFPRRKGQLASGQFQSSMVASRNYAPNEPLMEQVEPSLTKKVRMLIHDFRGMFNEAGIEIGPGRDIELSHHFGIEKFSETGALLISVVNAHYCKKLIAQLPGQSHPTHKHEIKDESFQVLWGDLHVTLDGKPRRLFPGEVLTVPHGTWHSFSTEGGVIFEEISTTSIKGDSVYKDQSINDLDPMWRKSVIESW